MSAQLFFNLRQGPVQILMGISSVPCQKYMEGHACHLSFPASVEQDGLRQTYLYQVCPGLGRRTFRLCTAVHPLHFIEKLVQFLNILGEWQSGCIPFCFGEVPQCCCRNECIPFPIVHVLEFSSMLHNLLVIGY